MSDQSGAAPDAALGGTDQTQGRPWFTVLASLCLAFFYSLQLSFLCNIYLYFLPFRPSLVLRLRPPGLHLPIQSRLPL
jgi:hypothetical protein